MLVKKFPISIKKPELSLKIILIVRYLPIDRNNFFILEGNTENFGLDFSQGVFRNNVN